MPRIPCPHCGREVQYPESLASSTVSCPAPGCGRPVDLPNLDGTFPSKAPAPPPLPSGPRRGEAYFVRKLLDSSVVVGPLTRGRLRELVREGKVSSEDELSVDRKKWWQAARVEPELFGGAAGSICPTCGAKLKPGHSGCTSCATDEADEPSWQGYGVGSSPVTAHQSLTAPAPIDDFASARSADDIVAVSADGWLGLFSTDEDRPRRTWTFDEAGHARVVVADEGGVAVVVARTRSTTRLYVADFESRRLAEVAELDGPVRQMALDPDGKYLALVDDAKCVRIYRVDPWKRIDKLPVRGVRFAFSLARDRMAAADSDGALAIWDLRKGKIERELEFHGKAACPVTPIGLGFSDTGVRLFAGIGYLVRPPAGVAFQGPTDFEAWLVGGLPGMILVNNAEWIAKDIQRAQWARTSKELERVTRLRSWDVDSGELTWDLSDICSMHPVGIGGAYFSSRSNVAVTVGPTNAHAWILGGGQSSGVIYNVTDPNDIRHAQAQIEGIKSFIRCVDFTHLGDNALVLVEGSKRIRVVPLPRESLHHI